MTCEFKKLTLSLAQLDSVSLEIIGGGGGVRGSASLAALIAPNVLKSISCDPNSLKRHSQNHQFRVPLLSFSRGFFSKITYTSSLSLLLFLLVTGTSSSSSMARFVPVAGTSFVALTSSGFCTVG